MKKSLRIFLFTIVVLGFTHALAFADGPSGGNPSPIGRGDIDLTAVFAVLRSLLGL